MKKLFLSAGLILAVVTITFFGCSKEENIKSSENISVSDNQVSNLSINDDRIVFDTREDYESTIDYLSNLSDEKLAGWEDEIGFLSMRKQYEDDNMLDEMPVKDELFATLLNPDGIIQIGENIFKIDVENEKVYSIVEADDCEENEFNYDMLKSGGISPEVKVFSTDDNVLDIIEGIESLDKKKRKYCRSKKVGWFYNTMSVGYKVEWKIDYSKYGIYYSLKAQIRQRNGGCGTVKLKINSNSFWKHRKGEDRNISGTYNGTMNLTRTVYRGSKRLTNYKMDVDFSHYCPVAFPTSFIVTHETNTCRK